jgi:capsular exopolysaccharide synthesis family protein
MRQRYRDKHPRLIEAVNTLAQTEQEMKTALVIAADSVRSEYENAQQNDADARQALADQEAKSLDLDKSGVEYEHLNREYRVNEEILESMLLHMREASVTSSIETQSARIVDRATEPLKPYSPRIAINLSIGALAGIVFGFGFAGLVAVVDDRIKSTFDVETLIGLPLVGMIPHATKLDQPDKAQLVSNGADRMIVESFLSLYSTLRINDESRNARYILVTSTMPGEGKSFVSSNLALTFAAQGQRVVLVDCDLRKPNVHKSFRINMGAGVINYCAGSAKMEDIVVRSVHPNLDLVTAGGRAKNPVLILNSQEFENLVSDLGKRYDRVIFDTPPLGAVSDALNILPLVDGSIYTIQFNRVRRSVAKRCVKRLQSANLPIFGAILNDTDIQTADYYGEYDQKAYKEYFNLDSDEPVAEAPRTKGRFTVRA